jgi:hypothetical protein
MLDTFCQFVKMRREGLAALREPRDPWGGIWDDYVNYTRFKEACLALPPNLNEAFMVMSIVSYTAVDSFWLGRVGQGKNNHCFTHVC